MRTLLAGEFTQATDETSDYYLQLEVQNASGTWIDVGAAVGSHWVISATWGETIDTPVSQATIAIVPRVGAASLAPLMTSSALNVDDLGAYAPLLQVGRLVRFNTATMAHLVPLDVTKYREMFTGRIDQVELADAVNDFGPITLTCSDLGAWLMDTQIETAGKQYGTTPVGTALETVVQNVINDWLPAGSPAVTVVKESASTFAVTDYTLGQVKVMEACNGLVLDATGEDFRYRYDASHVSQPMWYNPDRARVTVDQTFGPNQYLMQQLSTSIADVRNAGSIPAPQTPGAFKTASDSTSIGKYRRRWFQIPASPMLTTDTQAQTVITAAVNDLSDAPAIATVLLPYCWFPQLYDRYTFQAQDRQFDFDQTLGVTAVKHSIEGQIGRTTLTVAGKVIGAYAAWLRRLSAGTSSDAAILNVTFADATDNTTRTYTITVNGATQRLWVWDVTSEASPETNPWPPADATGVWYDSHTPTILTPTAGVCTYTATKPTAGHEQFLQLEPRNSAIVSGVPTRLTNSPEVPSSKLVVTEAATEDSSGNGTLTVTVSADPWNELDVTARIDLQMLNLTVLTTGIAPTSAPAVGTRTGAYVFTFAEDPKHAILVRSARHLSDGTTQYGPWTSFDSDKAANVWQCPFVVLDGATAHCTANFDTDTAIGAGNARWSVDGGVTWTTLTVSATRDASFTVALTSSAQTLTVMGKNSAGSWGPGLNVALPGVFSPTLTITSVAATNYPTTNNVDIAWTDSGFASGTTYDVNYNFGNGATSSALANQTSPVSVTVAGLNSTTPYVVTVNAMKSGVLVSTKTQQGPAVPV